MAVSDQQSLVSCAVVLLFAGAVPLRQVGCAYFAKGPTSHAFSRCSGTVRHRLTPLPTHMFSLFQLAHRQSCPSIVPRMFEAEVGTGY